MVLELKPSNMYASGQLIIFSPTEHGLYREVVAISPENGDQYHTVVQGDRLDALARKFYANRSQQPELYWWVIADANTIYDPTDISGLAGQKILIPDFLRVRLLL